ncbi:hypothetical protein P692DRAFT_201806873 [Suillus brevipes Sb2]|nr:hypothetical protein P692DRAFT_201806873 [Suillus brevipes Sb2]
MCGPLNQPVPFCVTLQSAGYRESAPFQADFARVQQPIHSGYGASASQRIQRYHSGYSARSALAAQIARLQRNLRDVAKKVVSYCFGTARTQPFETNVGGTDSNSGKKEGL